jgi:hypothetical protein
MLKMLQSCIGNFTLPGSRFDKTLNHVSSDSHSPQVPEGVNHWGLQLRILWQMDVTHISSFGWQCYAHVSVDTYSDYIYATVQIGEATKFVITHCLDAFAHAMACVAKLLNLTGSDGE